MRGRDSRSLWGPGDGRGAYKIGSKTEYLGSEVALDDKFCVTHICPTELVQHP